MSLVPPKPSPLAPGYRLDRYELLCPIAQGGMASVWVARLRGKHGFEKLIAIKTILPQYAADPRFQKMFLDEAHIAAGIEHVNVAQILDLGEEHDILYLVMEFVDGDSISKLLRATEKKNIQIPPGIVLRLMADVCAGLHAAHELHDREGRPLGIVHRDVSPQNVLVTNEGVAKIIDFGIAKARDRLAGDTGAGLLKGKVHYMPPEQALGKPVDRRADVWAVGAIAYHLLSGRTAFDAPNQLATLHLLTSGKPPLPLPSSLHPSVSHVVRSAMTFDVEKRVPTCAALRKALEEAMGEAELVTTTDDVAAFLAEHVGDRKTLRRQAIEIALKAAADRANVEKLLAPPAADSSSGIINHEGRLQAALEEMRMPPVPSEKTVAAKPMRPDATPTPAAEASAPGTKSLAGQNAFETSNATLGSAAVATHDDLEPAPPLRRKNKLIAGATVGAFALLGLVAVVIALSRKSEPDASASEPTTRDVPAAAATSAAAASTSVVADPTAAPEPTASAAPEAATVASVAKPSSTKPVVTAKPATPTFVPATPTTVKKKKRKDDGF